MSSDITACIDWSKWRTPFGPGAGSSRMSSVHGWRRSTSRERWAITVIASRQSVGQLAVGNDQLAHHRVVDERQQLVLGADVVVERHRAGIELGGEAAHRERVEALGVGDLDRGRGDLVPREACVRRAPGSGRVQTSCAAMRAVRSSSCADLRASSADACRPSRRACSATCSTLRAAFCDAACGGV